MTTVETLDLLVRANTDRAESNLQRFNAALTKFIGPAAIGAISAAFTAALARIRDQLDEIASRLDAVGKTATRLNIDPGSLIAWQNAAELAGIEARQLENLMVRMVDAIGRAESATTEQARALGRLNLGYQQLRNLSPETQLRTILVALDQVQNTTDRLSTANQIFGTRGSKALQLLAGGWQSLDAEIARASQSIPENMSQIVRSTEAANDAMSRMIQDGKNGMAEMALAMKQGEANITQAALRMQKGLADARKEFFAFGLAFQKPQVGGRGLFGGAVHDLVNVANVVGGEMLQFKEQRDRLQQDLGRRQLETFLGVDQFSQTISRTMFSAGKLFAEGIGQAIPIVDGIAERVEEALEGPTGETPAAAIRGSLEAFQGVQQAQRNEARLADRQRRRLLEENQRSNSLLTRILSALAGGEGLNVNPFQLARR